VVVTGIGIVSPLGNTLEDSWRQIIGNTNNNNTNHTNNNSNDNNDNCGVTTLEETLLSHQDLSRDQFDREWKIARSLPCQVAAPVRGLHEAFLTEDTNTDGTRNPRTTARFVQMALLAGSEAMKQANLIDWLNNNNEEETNSNHNNHNRRRDRFGVSVGSGMSSVREINTAWDTISNTNSIRKLSPHFIPKVLANSAAGRLSLEHGLRGPNLAPSTACAASAHAIGDAYRLIRTGASDIMLAGGAEASIEPLGLAGFCRLRALSTSFNDTPKEASRPFDAQRDGFVMGEGAAILVLEELEHAKERIRQEQADTTTTKPKTTSRILAEITGYAATGDAFHVTAPDEAGWGAEEAMLLALEEDRLLCNHPSTPTIGYINAHATSTPKGDQIEADVVDRVLRSQRKNHEAHSSSAAEAEAACCYMSSTKGMSGHLLGAAGALEAAFTIMSLVDQKIPPTLNLHLNDGDSIVDGKEGNIDGPLFTHVAGNRALEPISDIQMAVSNSFGFGGTNASLVFRRYIGDTGTGEKINT
jgi:3-oxoacyl-[acyl-carrier-protein] synthase II